MTKKKPGSYGDKYTRPGHIDLGRVSDDIANEAYNLLPGTGVLPSRWFYKSLEEFKENYKHLGPVVWAKTASYHMLLINGEYIFRIWTITTKSAVVDIHEALVSVLSAEVEDIPPNSLLKCKPMKHRIRMYKPEDVHELLVAAVSIFEVV